MLRHRRWHWLYAFLLICAQEAGIVHLTMHATRGGEPQTTGQGAAGECVKCAQFHAGAAAAAPYQPIWSFPPAGQTITEAPQERPVLAQLAAYRSRAPPVSA